MVSYSINGGIPHEPERERTVFHVAIRVGKGDSGARGITFYERVDFECFMEFALPEIVKRQPSIASTGQVSCTLNGKPISRDGRGGWRGVR